MALHSNLVIFKLREPWCTPLAVHLYIPIWLYSNRFLSLNHCALNHFTFQSGYIQITLNSFVSLARLNFTFQSGYIQICTASGVHHGSRNFTFQSGYIQIKSLPAVVIIVSIFTFQSGYIQISMLSFYSGRLSALYIPIWLYSNIPPFFNL